jgi:CheY-like chemotaxis protein
MAGRRVLIVDDNRDAAETLQEFVALLGHEARVAHDGQSALAVAREWPPSVALLDIGLPGMSGYEVARELRKLLQEPLRLVALSGYG